MIRRKEYLYTTRLSYYLGRARLHLAIIFSICVIIVTYFVFGWSANELFNLLTNWVDDRDLPATWFWGICVFLCSLAIWLMFCHTLQLSRIRIFYQSKRKAKAK